MAQRAFENVLNLFRLPKPPRARLAATPAPGPSPAPATDVVKPPLQPADLNGFWTVTGPTEATFYVTSNTWPRDQIGTGWVATGVTGLRGQLRVTGADLNLVADPLTGLPPQKIKKVSDKFSESYIWSFTLETDTDQSAPLYQYSTGTILYPPAQKSYVPVKRNGPLYGQYTVVDHVMTFVFSQPPLSGFGPGWTVTGLPNYAKEFRVVSFSDLGAKSLQDVGMRVDQYVYPTGQTGGGMVVAKDVDPTGPAAASGIGNGYVIDMVDGIADLNPVKFNSYVASLPPGAVLNIRLVTGKTVTVPVRSTLVQNQFAVFAPNDGSIPENTDAPVSVNGLPATIYEPGYTSDFKPGRFSPLSEADIVKDPVVDMVSVKAEAAPPLRDLGTGFACEPPSVGPYADLKDLGFSTGSLLSLFAIGPQEKYTLSEDFSKSQWDPSFKRHTNSVMYQRVIPFPPPNPNYQGATVQLELLPTELGHLLSNMYLKVTMPALATGYQYSPQLGRALIKQIDLLVNETVIETLYDDWYIVRDQLFLDADEQTGMFQAVGGSNINSQVATDYIIPLEFFFCRRKSHADSGNERLRRPYFPLCAMWNQKLYVRFTFQPNTWWCNVAAPHTTDLVLPKLVTEEILLDNAEKLYYQNTPLRYIVNRVKKESTLTFSAGNPQLQLTASFPVQTLAWFFRNKNYEATSTGLYSDSRYNYGYTTQYIQTGIQLQFPSGNSNYVDVIDNAKITLNNVDILSTFQGSLYYTFKQPLEHGLSIPSKNIYTYSFGLTPKEYNQGGYLNFSKLNSQTTTLTLVFNPSYATQITQGYNLYLFYYGYTLLEFQGGFARLPFV